MKIFNGIKFLAIISFIIILPVSAFAELSDTNPIFQGPCPEGTTCTSDPVSEILCPDGMTCSAPAPDLFVPDTSSQNGNANCLQDLNSHWDYDSDRCVLNNISDDSNSAPGPDVTPSQPNPDVTPSNPCPAGAGKICDPLGERYDSVPKFIKTILEGVIKIGLPVVALAIVYCGFLFVFARGKPESLTKARDALLYTMIGAAILLGSWAIAKMIQATVLSL